MNDQTIIAGYLASISTFSKKTLISRKAHLSLFQQFLSPGSFLEASKTDFAVFAQKCIDRGIKESSVKRYLSGLKQFYQYLDFEDLYPSKEYLRIARYVDEYKPEKGERGIRLSVNELDLIFKEIDSRVTSITLKAVTWFFLNTGVRAGELVRLKLRDVDLKNQLLTIHKSKWKKTRRIPIFDYQLPEIERWLQVRSTLLPNNSKEDSFFIIQSNQRPITYSFIHKNYYRIGAALAIHLHAHRLRRTCACILFYDLGLDIADVSFILGHESIQTTMEYLGISEQDKIDRLRENMKGKRISNFKTI